jgi:hypothetical protein
MWIFGLRKKNWRYGGENCIITSFIISTFRQILDIRVRKSRRVRWAGNVASTRRWEMLTKFWSKILREETTWESQD